MDRGSIFAGQMVHRNSNRSRKSAAVANRGAMKLRNVAKARRRAEEAGPVFFSGAEALEEVSKESGAWNWALVGPDPEALPLSGGGAKSADQMVAALGKHAHSFGLLRMTFGAGADSLTKWLFIHASDDSDATFSAVEKGRANAMEPKMEDAIKSFSGSVAAKVRIQSKEECTVEFLVEKLRSVLGGDSAKLTVERYRQAIEAHKQEHPEMHEDEKKEKQKVELLEKMQAEAPTAAAHQPEVEMVAKEDAALEPSRQRKKMKLFALGDVVEVYSSRQNKWFADAEVVDLAREVINDKGMKVPAGSTKIVYDQGTRFKWVVPQQLDQFVRPSTRPRPPEALSGELLKETHHWFSTSWEKYYFEVNKGFLQWWHSQEDAASKVAAAGSVYLLGLQQKDEGILFKLRVDSTGGAVFAFQAETPEEASAWMDTLCDHAAYCDDVREHFVAQMGGSEVRKELLSVMLRRELMSITGGRAVTTLRPEDAKHKWLRLAEAQEVEAC